LVGNELIDIRAGIDFRAPELKFARHVDLGLHLELIEIRQTFFRPDDERKAINQVRGPQSHNVIGNGQITAGGENHFVRIRYVGEAEDVNPGGSFARAWIDIIPENGPEYRRQYGI